MIVGQNDIAHLGQHVDIDEILDMRAEEAMGKDDEAFEFRPSLLLVEEAVDLFAVVIGLVSLQSVPVIQKAEIAGILGIFASFPERLAKDDGIDDHHDGQIEEEKEKDDE